MSEQQNIELVRRGYEAFGRGDIETLLSLFDEQIEWAIPGPPEYALAGIRRGRAAVASFFQQLNETFEITRFEPKEFIAQGDRVVVLGDDTSRLRATGTVHDFEFAHVFRVANGKITTFKEYGDVAPVVLALRASQAAHV